MIPEELVRIGAELRARREPFVTATVVSVQHPTSVNPGATALVHADGTVDGFVGGVCAQHSVRLYALEAIAADEPLLLRIVPDPDQEGVGGDPIAPIDAGQELARAPGAVTVRNPCLSGGAMEVFLEPMLPAPRLLVAGQSPIVAALAQTGPVAGFELVTAAGRRDPLVPAGGDFGLVVAAHGRDELGVLRAALELGLPYVGLVASPKRGHAVLEELHQAGVARELLDRVDTPAGLELGSETPGEIAIAILARAIQVRKAGGAAAGVGGIESSGVSAAPQAAATAIDPICGMEVVVMADTPSAERDGESFYFCCDGCQRTFVAQQAA